MVSIIGTAGSASAAEAVPPASAAAAKPAVQRAVQATAGPAVKPAAGPAAKAAAKPAAACGVKPANGSRPRAGLAVRNRLAERCAGVRPVVASAAPSRGPRHGDVQPQWRPGQGAGRHRTPMRTERGEPAGRPGPDAGLKVPARGQAAVPPRTRSGRGAPAGRWLTTAVAFERMNQGGRPVPMPVGASDPSPFQAAPAGHGHGQGQGGKGWQGHGHGGKGWQPDHGGPGRGHGGDDGRDRGRDDGRGDLAGSGDQLAATGASGDGLLLTAGAAALAFAGGAGLLLLRRAR